MKSKPKIAVIGAGSYVFSLSLLHDLIVDHRMQGAHLCLMDLDAEMAADMAAIARQIAGEAGVEVAVESTGSRELALEGADFVTTSVAAQLIRRYEIDKQIIRKHGIREILSECGGLGGLSYTLRSVPLILGIARDMERLCPDAWLLNMSNPLPRVLDAVMNHTSIKALGFCNNAWGDENGYGPIARELGREVDDIAVVTAGLNHFTWLLSVRDARTGEDLMPELNLSFRVGPLQTKLWHNYGALPLGGDTHVGEFVPFEPHLSEEHTAHHGTSEERDQRRAEIREAAEGKRSWHYLMENYGRSWERPADVIHALATGSSCHLDMVNLRNDGAIANLPDEAIVEVPADVLGGAVEAVKVGELPAAVAELCSKVSAAHHVAAEAAVTGSRELVAEAIRIDPAITEKDAALEAIGEMIVAHTDLLPQFA